MISVFSWQISISQDGDGIPVELFQILKDDGVKVLHSVCQQIWKTQQWPKDWKRSLFISVLKKGNAKEYLDYQTVALIMSANLENSAVVTGLEKVGFHPNPKEGQCQRMFQLPYNCTHFTC